MEKQAFNQRIDVRLAQYGADKLVTRSQAKRILAGINLFRTAWFDFRGVESIGHPFADEIFRVFANAHADITLFVAGTTEKVRRTIAATLPPSNVFFSS
jgi:hypothetical protein